MNAQDNILVQVLKHDLINKLNVITSGAKVIIRDYDNQEKLLRNAWRVLNSSESIHQMFLNAIALLSNEKLAVELISPNEIFSSSVFFDDQRIEIGSLHSERIKTNKYAMAEVFENLVKNSFRANAKKITINSYISGKELVFVFSDDGDGMAKNLGYS